MASEHAQGKSAMTSALSRLDAVKDVLTVKRVFGDAYEVDGVTVIPVAAVRGGGGGGGGEGDAPDGQVPVAAWGSASTYARSAPSWSPTAPSAGCRRST